MRTKIICVLLSIAFAFASCEQVITIQLNNGEPVVVVEGSIENDRPPLVILSRSFPFFGDVNINDITALLLKGGMVTVTDGIDTVVLMEYNRENLIALDEEDFALIAPILEQYLGFEIEQSIIEFIPDITFYTVAPDDYDFVGIVGRSYWLDVRFEAHELFGDIQLTAQTFIPFPVMLDSLWVEPHPNEEIDTLFELRTRLQEPDTSGNYYRYFTRANGGPWLTTDASVFDDAFINGESIPFTVFLGQTERAKLEESNFDVDGYWSPGDTAEVRLSMITGPHYRFWRTVENEKGNLGNPFGSFTVIASNVTNGVGIWGGYASTTISMVIPEL